MISADCCYDQGHVDVGDSTQERHVIISSWFNCALTQLNNNRIETHFDGVMSAFVFPWVPIACLRDTTYVCANWDKPQASRLQAARLPVRLAVSTSWWVQVEMAEVSVRWEQGPGIILKGDFAVGASLPLEIINIPECCLILNCPHCATTFMYCSYTYSVPQTYLIGCCLASARYI